MRRAGRSGYELTDANIPDIAGFLVVMAASIAVVFVLAFGIGKLIYFGLNKQDGAANKWSQMAGMKPGNMESNPQIEQQQLQSLVKRFPRHGCKPTTATWKSPRCSPRRHAAEHYTWVDQNKQTVRIPIERAMELIAQKGCRSKASKAPRSRPCLAIRPTR